MYADPYTGADGFGSQWTPILPTANGIFEFIEKESRYCAHDMIQQVFSTALEFL